jgi:hypothetical protein
MSMTITHVSHIIFGFLLVPDGRIRTKKRKRVPNVNSKVVMGPPAVRSDQLAVGDKFVDRRGVKFQSRRSKTMAAIIDKYLPNETGTKSPTTRLQEQLIADGWALHLDTWLLVRESLGFLIPNVNSKGNWMDKVRTALRCVFLFDWFVSSGSMAGCGRSFTSNASALLSTTSSI